LVNFNFSEDCFGALSTDAREDVAHRVMRDLERRLSQAVGYEHYEATIRSVYLLDPVTRQKHIRRATSYLDTLMDMEKRLKDRFGYKIKPYERLLQAAELLPLLEPSNARFWAGTIARCAIDVPEAREDGGPGDRSLLCRLLPWFDEAPRKEVLEIVLERARESLLFGWNTSIALDFSRITLPKLQLSSAQCQAIFESFRTSTLRRPVFVEVIMNSNFLQTAECKKKALVSLLGEMQDELSDQIDDDKDLYVRFALALARVGLIKEAIGIARRLKDETLRASALARVVTFLPPENQADTAFEAIGALSTTIENVNNRAAAIRNIALAGQLLEPQTQKQLMHKILRFSSARSRSEMLKDVSSGMSLAITLGGRELIPEMKEATTDVVAWTQS
jgi:hypothetical protein